MSNISWKKKLLLNALYVCRLGLESVGVYLSLCCVSASVTEDLEAITTSASRDLMTEKGQNNGSFLVIHQFSPFTSGQVSGRTEGSLRIKNFHLCTLFVLLPGVHQICRILPLLCSLDCWTHQPGESLHPKQTTGAERCSYPSLGRPPGSLPVGPSRSAVLFQLRRVPISL